MRLVLTLIIALFFGACSQPEQAVYKTRILSFGTYIDVSLAEVSKEQADSAIQSIEQELDYMHEQWHAWRPSSVTELNKQLQSGTTFKVKPELLPLIEQSRDLYNKSLGHFNPAIGKLIELWGFYSDEPQENKTIPELAIIKTLIQSGPHMNDIHINGQLIKGVNPDIQIDFGGYAKGFGIDQLITQLQSKGINNALISAGGDIKGIGTNHGKPWRIAIQDPYNKSPLGWLALKSGESIFTSGSYERAFVFEGQSFHHIIDPQTGYPSTEAQAVTVIGTDAATADAAATALMIAPKDEWLTIMQNMQIKHLLIVDRDGKLYADQGLANRLTLLIKEQLHIIDMVNRFE